MNVFAYGISYLSSMLAYIYVLLSVFTPDHPYIYNEITELHLIIQQFGCCSEPWAAESQVAESQVAIES